LTKKKKKINCDSIQNKINYSRTSLKEKIVLGVGDIFSWIQIQMSSKQSIEEMSISIQKSKEIVGIQFSVYAG
jgi:hypothetical protein